MNTQWFLNREKASRDTIDFKMIYVDISWDLIAWLMLSQIIYWNLPDKKGQSKLKVVKGWSTRLAKSDKDWYGEIRITKDQARRARKILTEKWIIECDKFKFSWAPTTHIRVNWDVLVTQMDLGLNPNGNGSEPKSLTETTSENTSDILPKGNREESPEEKSIEWNLSDKQENNQEKEKVAGKRKSHGNPDINEMIAAVKKKVEENGFMYSAWEKERWRALNMVKHWPYWEFADKLWMSRIDATLHLLDIATDFRKPLLCNCESIYKYRVKAYNDYIKTTPPPTKTKSLSVEEIKAIEAKQREEDRKQWDKDNL